MKTVCVYHSIDLGGWMSAAIVKHWFIENVDRVGEEDLPIDNLDFIGYNYGEPIPDLSEYDSVIMCDISFPKEEMLNINKRLGESFIWIDHHQSKIDEVNSYIIEHGIPMEGLVTEPGEFNAACELTWQYFFPNKPMPGIVRLLGRYDCFGHKGTDEEQYVLEFQYGARQCITNYELAYEYLQANLISGDSLIYSIRNAGMAIYDYLCTEAKQVYKNGFDVIFNSGTANISLKFICINKERFNPINFGIDYHKDGYDGCACFHYDGVAKLWRFSLYNDNGNVDCSILAKVFNGGDRKGAAGFTLTNSEFIKIFSNI
jgi:hypothetical protein